MSKNGTCILFKVHRDLEQMTLPQNLQHFTIGSMAYEAGFSSRSAFYNAFKLMGTSPVDFARNMKK